MIAVYVLLRGGVFKQGESYYDSWDLFLILSMSHFVTLGQTSVCSSGTHLLYRNRNLSYFGALWSLINICRILWGAQRKLVTNIDSFSQSTYTLPTKTFCKPYPEAGIWDHRLHILFNLLCSACYQLCAWVITVQFYPFTWICKQIERCEESMGWRWPSGLPWAACFAWAGISGCFLSCWKPTVLISRLCYWFSAREQCEVKGTSG